MDFYVILGLEHGATESEIKRAYRRLARRYHPDINPGDRTAEGRFRQILEAYETLIDPARRSKYDSGTPVAGHQGRSTGFEGFDFSGRAVDHAATFGDLFAEVLTAPAEPRPPRGGGRYFPPVVFFLIKKPFNGAGGKVSGAPRRDVPGVR